mmetsp:Transcript_31643/g.35977  ORF Transcript_31643/g.35977 Transcript_31643/m.35977 type:complete len:109 (-) Transcript_31643:499-825(-)
MMMMMIRNMKRCVTTHKSLQTLSSSCIINRRDIQTTSKSMDVKENKSLFFQELNENEYLRDKLAYSLSYASSDDKETFFCRTYFNAKKPTDLMKEQLNISGKQLTTRF